jgi:hypothetical protein
VKPKPGDGVKTSVGVFVVMTGEKKGMTMTVPKKRITVFGYNLRMANLVGQLQYGEEGTIEFK